MTVEAGARSGTSLQSRVTEPRLRVVIGIVSLVGIAIAGYLTYTHYAGIKVLCLSSGGCETVQTSTYSKLAGVPVSLLGLIGFGFSAYLTYRELFTIKAICQWCVASAVLMTILAILTSVRMLRTGDGGP